MGITEQVIIRNSEAIKLNLVQIGLETWKGEQCSLSNLRQFMMSYSRSFMMRATRLSGSMMAFRLTPRITLSLDSTLGTI